MYKYKKTLIMILLGSLVGLSLTFLYNHLLFPYNIDSNYKGKNFYINKVEQKENFIVFYKNENVFKRNKFLYLCPTKKIENLPLLNVNCSERDK